MQPWSVDLYGSKSEILERLDETDAPDCAKQALRLLFAPMAELPGYTDEDPAIVWEKTVPHTSADKVPLKREERLRTYWKVVLVGHPEAHGVSEVRIDGQYDIKRFG